MKAHIIILFLTVVLISCAPTRNLSFEIMSPALIDLPDSQDSYLILNSSYIPDTIQFNEHLFYYLFSEDKIILDTLITRQLFDGLFNVLNESPIHGLFKADYLEIRTTDTTGYLNPLSPEAVSEICSDYNADHLISFEYYDLNVDLDSYPTPNSSYFSNFSFSSYCKIKNKLVWRMYGRDGKPEDDYVFMDTLYWYDSRPTFDDSRSTITNTLDYIRDAFWIAGNEYGKRISPYWEKVNRPLYKIFEKWQTGFVNITRNKNRLQVQSNSKNKTKASKACYNLAVLTESEGDISNALIWIDKAKMNKQNIYVIQYDKILRDRQKNLEKLKKQTE